MLENCLLCLGTKKIWNGKLSEDVKKMVRFIQMIFNSIPFIIMHGFSNFISEILTRMIDRMHSDMNDDPELNGEYYLLNFFLRNNMRRNMILLDVGANVGDWTSTALSVNSSLSVFLFEPSVKIFKKLADRFEGDTRVTCINVGLADTCGKNNFNIFHENAGSNSLFKYPADNVDPIRFEEVSLITGDLFLKKNGIQYVDLMKIDVEGAEICVLNGFLSSFEKRIIKICQIEYGASYISARTYLADVFAFASKTNYKVAKVYPNGIRLISFYHHKLETFKYANYLLIEDISLLKKIIL